MARLRPVVRLRLVLSSSILGTEGRLKVHIVEVMGLPGLGKKRCEPRVGRATALPGPFADLLTRDWEVSGKAVEQIIQFRERSDKGVGLHWI